MLFHGRLRFPLLVLLALLAHRVFAADCEQQSDAAAAPRRFDSVEPYLNEPVVPDNPEFWVAYDSLLAADPLPAERLEDNLPASQGFIKGTQTDAQRLRAQVMAHRRRLGVSNVVIDKLIFTATTGILLPAINVYMARGEGQWISPEKRLLDEMLLLLTKDELSLRRAMDGELCLDAVDVHASVLVEWPASFCHQYLIETSAGRGRTFPRNRLGTAPDP